MLESILIKSDINMRNGIIYNDKIKVKVSLAVEASTPSLLKCLLAVR